MRLAILLALLCAASAFAEDGSTAAGKWEFITDDTAAEAPAATPEPSVWLPEEEDDGDAANAGIDYPVQAEVVNCRKSVSLRAKPSTKAALLAEVPLGALVWVQSNDAWQGDDRWFVDAEYGGQRGYICVEYLDVLLPDDMAYGRGYGDMAGTVRAVDHSADLVLRAGPGTGYDSLGLLFGGETLGYTGESRQDASGTCWYRCSHCGEDCWISAKYTVLTLSDGTVYTGSSGIY